MKPLSAQPDDAGGGAGPLSSGRRLELPVDPGFASEPPHLTGDQLFEMNLAYLKSSYPRPEDEERRLREKCDVPFEL
jgi:hypothetical protein